MNGEMLNAAYWKAKCEKIQKTHTALMQNADQRYDELFAKLAAAEAKCVELEKDAERYRWLREQKNIDIAACWFLPAEQIFDDPESPSDIDAAIDAARAALPQPSDTQRDG